MFTHTTTTALAFAHSRAEYQPHHRRPDWYAWRGGCDFARSDGFAARCVTRAEYNEKGHALCFERFDGEKGKK